MHTLTRRTFLQASASTGACLIAGRSLADDPANIKFTTHLSCGSIGVQADQMQAIRLAKKYGFGSVSADASYLAGLDSQANNKLVRELEESNLVWGTSGLPVQFTRDEATFSEGIKRLPRLAAALQRAGVTRVGTWISPSHSELTYRSNFRRHVSRLRTSAKVLGDHGLRLGLEYIGPKTLWASKRHTFVHTLSEAMELIHEIGLTNVGVVLDSWHWYTAHETVEDLRILTNNDIVACDLNDAPSGIAVDEQIDNQRELPATTGVINVRDFLGFLVDVRFDGPIRAEPFNAKLNAMEDEAAVAATATAMRKAIELLSA